jgi:hypothetical protein
MAKASAGCRGWRGDWVEGGGQWVRAMRDRVRVWGGEPEKQPQLAREQRLICDLQPLLFERQRPLFDLQPPLLGPQPLRLRLQRLRGGLRRPCFELERSCSGPQRLIFEPENGRCNRQRPRLGRAHSDPLKATGRVRSPPAASEASSQVDLPPTGCRESRRRLEVDGSRASIPARGRSASR